MERKIVELDLGEIEAVTGGATYATLTASPTMVLPTATLATFTRPAFVEPARPQSVSATLGSLKLT